MMKHITAITAMCFAVVVRVPIYGQQQENTLGKLWPVVEQNYSGRRAKQSAVDAAKFNELSVKSGYLPQLKVQAQNTYGTFQGSAGAFFPQPGFFNVSGSSSALNGDNIAANSFGSATVDWEIYSFGSRSKDNEASVALTGKVLAQKDAYLVQLKKILAERYITLLYHDAKQSWTEKNAQRLDEIRKTTSGLSAAGLRPAADSLLASSSYLQSIGEFDRWKGNKDASSIKLLELYNGETVNYLASAIRFNNPDNNYSGSEIAIDPSHPILNTLDKESLYYAAKAESQKRAALPSLNLLAGYAFRGTGIGANGTVSGAWNEGFHNATNNFLVGIGITWNVTSLRTNHFKAEGLFKDAERTKFLHAQYQQAMQADLSGSQAKIHQQYELIQKMKLAVKQSQDAYQMYVARYKSGLIALSELLQVRLLLEQAENNQIEASYEYWMLQAFTAELTTDFDFLFNNL